MNPHVGPLVGPLDFHNYLKRRRRGSYNSMTYGYVENSSFIMSVDTFSNRLVFPCWVTFEVFIAGESGPVWVRLPVRELLLSRLFQKPAALTSPAPPLPVHSSFHEKAFISCAPRQYSTRDLAEWKFVFFFSEDPYFEHLYGQRKTRILLGDDSAIGK